MKKYTVKILCIFVLILSINRKIFSQNVSINDNGAAPNSHAILDVDISTNDAGILIPRLTSSQRTAMTLPVADEGLTVYDETVKLFYFWTGSEWKEITTRGSNWSITGNSAINSSSNFIGTVDANDFVIRTNNVERARILSAGNFGIGTSNPDAKLHVVYTGAVMTQYPGTVAAFQQNNATTDWARMSIIGGNAGASLIDFGDVDKQDPGSIKYDHTDNYFAFFTGNTNERMRITSSGNVGIMVTDPDETLEVNGSIKMTDGNEGINKVMVSDASGTGSWSNENDGVKTRIINLINQSGDAIIWTHPENIEVRFKITDPNNNQVTVENKSGDATHYWNVSIIGGATGRESVESVKYKADFLRDDGTNDVLKFDLGGNLIGWFKVICTDQNNEKDGFILNVMCYNGNINGTVQYWDN